MLLQAAVLADDLVLYDDRAALQFSELSRVGERGDAAYLGAAGLRVQPTKWHEPRLRLAGGRTDFRRYSFLTLWIRATEGTIDPTIFVWDYANGTRLEIADYVDGGVVDEQWRKVVIPIEDLASEDFALESVYVVSFGPMGDPVPFDIDEIQLVDSRRPVVSGWEALSDRVLALDVDHLDHDALGPPARFSVSSTTDVDYRQPRSPLAVGSSRRAVEVLDGGLGIRERSRVYLLLPQPLEAGRDYRLALDGLVAPSGLGMSEPALALSFQQPEVSASIKVNQVGYARDATKLVFVGNWLGDAGPMPVDSATFEVVSADSGARVFSGPLQLRQAADSQSGEDVYTGDFSALTAAGRYRVSVPGLGRSYPFEIRDDIYADVYRKTMRVFYHKRNTPLTAPFADPGFERAAVDPALNALLHPVLADYPLSRGEQPFAYKPIRDGWFDAGDYGQYIHNAAPVWGLIGIALDLAAPGQFADGELGIPESGNGIPDVIDELNRGMTWALSMQDTDGGVYWRVTPATWDLGLPAEATEPRYVYEKTTRASAQFAAMGALFSRLIRPYDSGRAAEVLAAARAAWDYAWSHPFWPPEGTLYKNPDELPGGGEYAIDTAKPDLLWAAAELYRTTGETGFQDRYRDLLEEVSLDLGAAPFSTFGQWAILNAEYPARDVILLERARRALTIGADIKLERSQQSPYRSPKHPYIGFTGWSNFAASPMWSLALLQAYSLTGQAVYQDLAWQLVDIMLGANPLSQVFLTGIGSKSVTDPLDRVLLNDGNPDPLPGVPVPGPMWHLDASREPFISVNAAYFPPEAPATEGDWASAYPVLRRYIDDHQLIPMNESTLRELAAVAMAFGLLRDASITAPVRSPVYPWVPGEIKTTRIYRLNDIPVADVPGLTPAQITAFGAEAVLATDDRLAALTPAQVAAIHAPDTPYWVAKLSLTQRLALTAAQIAAFTQWSLFIALPPELVPLIPPANMPLIGTHLRETSAAWKAAVTDAQYAAMTDEQRAIMDESGGGSRECSVSAWTLEDLVLSSGIRNFRSETSLRVAGTVAVGDGAMLTLAAPSIRFEPGFGVALGGRMTASTRSVDCEAISGAADSDAGRAAASAAGGSAGAPDPRPPRLITDAPALPAAVQGRLSGIGVQVDAIVSAFLDADDRWIVIETPQSLQRGDANTVGDVYKIDLGSGVITLVSVTPVGRSGNRASSHPAVDASGELIVYQSDADDLIAADLNAVSDIFLRDVALEQTTRLSSSERASSNPAVDAAGAMVLFDQRDEHGRRHVLGQPLNAGLPAEVLSRSEGPSGAPVDSHHPAISPDGRFVAYLEEPLGPVVSDCRMHVYDRDTEVYHRQPCPPALADASEVARPLFSFDSAAVNWHLPGGAEPIVLPNLLIGAED